MDTRSTADSTPLVAIIMGSANDAEPLKACHGTLIALSIPVMARVISAHRTPNETADFAKGAHNQGLEVIIAAAGASAALPGVVAAHSHLPVIGVPLNATSLGGLDALFSIAQMPGGVPVATMGIGPAGAKNAALFAARLLALKYPPIKENLILFLQNQHREAQKRLLEDPFISAR
jgi:phosphoribosylaminoimidazole carboxylase PurE protein